MYTLQSGQIENALRVGGAGDVSAKQMVQQLANCQQLLEHRGRVELTKPIINYFPTIQPANNSVNFPFTYKNVNVTVPPFQMAEWKPIPFVPAPPWQSPVYPKWPGFGWESALPADQSAPGTAVGEPVGGAITSEGARPATDGSKPLTVPGGGVLGPTTISEVDAGRIGAVSTDVATNVTIGGNVAVGGDQYVGGDSFVNNDVTVQNNLILNGPMNAAGPVVVGGVPLDPFTMTVVSDVFWADDALKATVRTIRVFGIIQRLTTKTIISGTECP